MRDFRFYVVFYATTFVCLCLIWMMPALEYKRLETENEKAWLQTLPVWSYDQLRREAEVVQAELEGPASDDAYNYYRTLIRYYSLNKATTRYLSENQDPILEAKVFMGLWGTIPSLQARYQERFGADHMHQLSKDHREEIDRHSLGSRPVLVSHDSLWDAMVVAYIWTIFLGIPFFMVRLRRRDMSVFVDSWRMPVAVLAWPVGMFVYPTRVDPRKQLQRARQFVRWSLTALLSLAPMGAAGAQQSSKGGSRKGDSAAQVDNASPAITLSWAMYSRKLVAPGAVPHDGPVTEAQVTATFSNGLLVDLWAQTGTDGKPNAGREIDMTVGWGNKYLQFGLTYFDLFPQFNDSGGDVIRPYLEFTLPVPVGDHTLTPFARSEYMYVTRGTDEKSATLSFAGLRHQWQVTDTLALRHGMWLVYDDGVFGRQQGGLFRYRAAISWRTPFGFTVRPVDIQASQPFGGIHDRELETTVGGGIVIPIQ